jgi:hypothetical protein
VHVRACGAVTEHLQLSGPALQYNSTATHPKAHTTPSNSRVTAETPHAIAHLCGGFTAERGLSGNTHEQSGRLTHRYLANVGR